MPDSRLSSPAFVRVMYLSAQLELFENRSVAIEVSALEVVEQLTSACGHGDESAARVKVLAIFAKVLGEVLNACSEQRDLNFRGAGVVFIGTEFLDDFCFIE